MSEIITVIDGYPGIGKTSWAIQEINKSSDQKILYITPYLEEVDRIAEKCSGKDFYKPDPSRGRGNKMRNLIDLVKSGKNIITTHALIERTEKELIDALRGKNYILYIDESQQVIHKFNLHGNNYQTVEDSLEADAKTSSDLSTLVAKGFIEINPANKKVSWIEGDDNKLHLYDVLMNECQKGHVYSVNNSFFMWTFPDELFKNELFSEIVIMTHRFESLQQAYFFRYFDIPTRHLFIVKKNNKYETTDDPTLYNENQWKQDVGKLIKIHEHEDMNLIGQSPKYENKLSDPTLSKTFYDNADAQTIRAMKRYLQNFYGYYCENNVRLFYWTCFISHQNRLRSKNVTPNRFLPVNARAINDYRNCKNLAYLVNRYLDPSVGIFFRQKDIVFDVNEWALSELIQWIWRSRIREFKDIFIYIPSVRMRSLLQEYFNLETIEYIKSRRVH